MSILKKISEVERPITLLITISGLVITLANFWLISSIQPVKASIDKVEARVAVVETSNSDDVSQSQLSDAYTRLNLRIDDLITRVNAIDNRLGAIQDALIKR